MVLTGLHPLHVTGQAMAKTRGFPKFAIYGEITPYLMYLAHKSGLAISREIILFPRTVGNNGKIRDLMGNTGNLFVL